MTKPASTNVDAQLDELLHKFAGCGYPHPYYMFCEWCDKLPEFKQAITKLIADREREALRKPNDLLRSMYHIAERKGERTNWGVVAQHLADELKREHEFIHPKIDRLAELRKEGEK